MPNVPLTTRFIGISPSVDLEEKRSAMINAETQPYSMQDIVDTVSPTPPAYLKYVALLNQEDTDAPVATVLENTLGGIPVWERGDEGGYFCFLEGAFPENKTFCLVTYGEVSGIFGVVLFGRGNDDAVFLNLKDPSDGSLIDFENAPANDICVEIRVYP
jgi:hypothetical protein